MGKYVVVAARPSEKWCYWHVERPPPTRDNDIPLIPCEISENGVQSMRGIRHENDFFGPSADKLRHAMSGRCEVLGNMQFNESVDIAFYELRCSLNSSRNWDWHGTVGACKDKGIRSAEVCGPGVESGLTVVHVYIICLKTKVFA